MKKKYRSPKIVNMSQEIYTGVAGALTGAAWMIARAVAKAVKGHVDVKAGTDTPKTLQARR